MIIPLKDQKLKEVIYLFRDISNNLAYRADNDLVDVETLKHVKMFCKEFCSIPLVQAIKLDGE